MNVRVLFTYPTIFFKPFAWIIKKRLGTSFSHVCFVIDTGPRVQVLEVYQASKGRVWSITLERFLEENRIIKERTLQMNEEQFFRMLRYLKNQLGKKYSSTGAIASTFSILRKIGLGRNGDESFICSELVVRAIEEGFGLDIDFSSYRRDSDDYVDPLVFERWMDDHGGEL